jgi:hypothetical protein
VSPLPSNAGNAPGIGERGWGKFLSKETKRLCDKGPALAGSYILIYRSSSNTTNPSGVPRGNGMNGLGHVCSPEETALPYWVFRQYPSFLRQMNA